MTDTVSTQQYQEVVNERDELLNRVRELEKEIAHLNNSLNSWKQLANMCRDEIARLDRMIDYKTGELLHTEPTPADYANITRDEPWDGKLESEKRKEREHEYELQKADRFYENMAACISYKCSPMGQYMRNGVKEYE